MFTLLIFIFLGFNQSIQANDAHTYKNKITDIMNSDGNNGENEYYHIRFNKTASSLLINIKLPSREEIYNNDFYSNQRTSSNN